MNHTEYISKHRAIFIIYILQDITCYCDRKINLFVVIDSLWYIGQAAIISGLFIEMAGLKL